VAGCSGIRRRAEFARTRVLMMLVLDLGIGMGGAAIILGLYLAMRGD
jgi:hypothetical protein